MNALAAGGLENFLAELGLAAVEYVLDAERSEKRLFRGAGRGEHFRARGLCQLDGRQSDSARSGVDEDTLSRLQPRELVRKRRRHEGARYGGECRDRHPGWSRRQQFLMSDHFRPECAEPQANHAVSDGNGRHIGANADDVTA